MPDYAQRQREAKASRIVTHALRTPIEVEALEALSVDERDSLCWVIGVPPASDTTWDLVFTILRARRQGDAIAQPDDPLDGVPKGPRA